MLHTARCEGFTSQALPLEKGHPVENSDLPYLCPWSGFVMYVGGILHEVCPIFLPISQPPCMLVYHRPGIMTCFLLSFPDGKVSHGFLIHGDGIMRYRTVPGIQLTCQLLFIYLGCREFLLIVRLSLIWSKNLLQVVASTLLLHVCALKCWDTSRLA